MGKHMGVGLSTEQQAKLLNGLQPSPSVLGSKQYNSALFWQEWTLCALAFYFHQYSYLQRQKKHVINTILLTCNNIGLLYCSNAMPFLHFPTPFVHCNRSGSKQK